MCGQRTTHDKQTSTHMRVYMVYTYTYTYLKASASAAGPLLLGIGGLEALWGGLVWS